MPPRARALACLLSLASIAACHGSRSQARSALEAGDARRAIDLYDEALASDPNDEEARNERREARRRLTSELLTAAEQAELTGNHEVAWRSTYELCGRVDQWSEPLKGTEGLRFSSLEEGLRAEALGRVDVLAAKGRYLDLAKIPREPGLRCGLLTALRNAVGARVAQHTQGRCLQLEASTREIGPYARGLAERSCVAMGASPAAHIALPHQVSRVELAGSLQGVSPALLESLRTSVFSSISKGSLFDPAAPAALEITVAGYVRYAVTRTPTMRSQPWTEQVPYMDTETYQESYQEPYTDTEYYSERVPYTRYAYVNGRSSPVTDYRTETRSRPVTKYRTQFRTRTRPVTRYRAEPRLFTYPAVRVQADYEAAFTSEVHAPLLRTTSIAAARSETEDAYQHDASFGPAGVSPSSGEVRPLPSLFADDVAFVARRYASDWRTSMHDLACKSASFGTIELGARCVWLAGAEAPDPAFLALQPVFGADVPAMAELSAL